MCQVGPIFILPIKLLLKRFGNGAITNLYYYSPDKRIDLYY